MVCNCIALYFALEDHKALHTLMAVSYIVTKAALRPTDRRKGAVQSASAGTLTTISRQGGCALPKDTENKVVVQQTPTS